MKSLWLLCLLVSLVSLVGCGKPYFLVESKLVESNRLGGAPDVIETQEFRSMRGNVRSIGIQPPDVCADQGMSAGGGSSQLQTGVLRTRCGVEMAELERALAKAGYRVVSWGSARSMADKQKISLLEAATKLNMDVLLQVNALERVNVQPGRDARWERRFYRATSTGIRRAPARVDPSVAKQFEGLIAPKESSLLSGKRVGATINVSAISVESGAAIWFYEWMQVDQVAVAPEVEVLVTCDKVCVEVRKKAAVGSGGPVEGSISGVSVAGDPADEAQKIFHDLVRDLVGDLAERFAGRRS